MIIKNYSIALDFDKGTKFPRMRFIRGDSESCSFTFSIVQDISDLSLLVTFKMPDDTIYISNTEIIDPHKAYLLLPSGVLSQTGKVLCQAAIHNAGRLTNAVAFSYTVDDDFSEGAVEPSDNLPILTQLITECEAIKDEEELRVLAELARASAFLTYDGRINQVEQEELLRVSEEANRVIAESTRAGNELLRVASENDRIDSEDAREEAEILRLAAEGNENSGRVKAELDREEAEGLRTSAEAARVNAEGNSTKGRVKAETDRANAESARVLAENARAIAEGNAISGRVKAENDRVIAESARVGAEGARVIAEEDRDYAEGLRASAETDRVNSENARTLFEPYDDSKAYVVGNKVSYNGSSYLCIQNGKNKNPTTEPSYWLLFASKGDIGPSIVSAEFSDNDIVFEKDDEDRVVLVDAKLQLKGDTGNGLEFAWDDTKLGVKVAGTSTYQYVDLEGDEGPKGDTGTGITSIARTSGTGAAGTTDTYTITYSDSSTSVFYVYNGADGEGSGDMLKSVYDQQNKNQDIFAYVDDKVKTDVPEDAEFTDTQYSAFDTTTDGLVKKASKTGDTDKFLKGDNSWATPTDTTYSEATITTAGLMSATDKDKLNNVDDNANNYSHPNHTGDVTSTGDGATVIGDNKVTNAMLSTVTANTIKGRKTAGTGNVEDLSATDVRSILNVADGANNYVHPATAGNKHIPSGGETGKILGYDSDGTAKWINETVPTKTDLELGNVTNDKQMPIAGGTFTGQAKAQANTSYTTAQLRNVIMSTADPSGGNNGDIWIKYE